MYPAIIEDYLRPNSVDEALKAAGKYDAGEAMFIAGGQSLMQAVKSRLVRPRCVIDLQSIKELKGISASGAGIRIGAMTRYVDVAADTNLKRAYGALSDAAAHVGDRQVRNRGTIGGSLCWNYVAACMPAANLAVGSSMELISATGKKRTVIADEFIKGPLETARADDEVLLAITLPAAPAKAGSAYKKWGVVTDALPVIGVAVYIEVDGGGAITKARLGVGGLSTGPKRAKGAEAALIGKKAGEAGIGTALEKAAAEIETQSDHWADSTYRKNLIRTLGADILASAFARAAGK
ncbi:MAG: xanthine dehydrogenase family protein subunit M [Alphaproteobacteria bacterium]|nr:xanthine dehydrogenase family protein subunit M [Alphaproteobacteria bacterium]